MSETVDAIAEAADAFARRGFVVLEDVLPTSDVDQVSSTQYVLIT